jgi:glycosyltransferase involved in cell wall biosynthesis
VPYLAAVTGSARRTRRSVAVSGWLACPGGARPEPTATIAGRRAVLRLEPHAGELPGVPAAWSAWRWEARADHDDADGDELLVVLSDGEVIVSRDVRTDGTLVPAPRGGIDNPAQDAVVETDLLMVSGWLVLDDRLPSRIEVQVDSRAVAARLMIPRPDLAAALPETPDAVLAGFEARVPVDLSPGESRPVEVRLRAWARDGRSWAAPVRSCTMRVRSAEPDEVAASRRAMAVTARLLAADPPVADPRHVLVVAHSLRVAGGELWLAELLNRLVRDHGLTVTVVAPEDGALRPELEALGIGVRLIGNRRVAEALDYESYVTELSLLMRGSGAGVVLVNTLGFFAGVDAALRAELPVAWAIHESFTLPDFAYLNWGPRGLAPTVHARWLHCLAHANALVFVADATRELFLPHADPARCLTVRYGIDTGYLTAAGESTADLRESLGVPRDAQVLLNVGVSEPRKGHGPLLAAFDVVRRRHPDTQLVIVGLHDSPYCEALRDRVARRGLNGQVSLVPIVRDPLPWFRIADLFVNCSDIESLPRTILEAMALRLPVVATDVFGARELITDGESGWLCQPNDLNALIVGLLRALDTSRAERALVADRAHAHVEPLLDPAGYGAEFAKLLGGLTERHHG